MFVRWCVPDFLREWLQRLTTRDRDTSIQWRDAVLDFRQQWRALWFVMLLIYTPVIIAFAIVIAVRLTTGIAIAEFTRDPLGFTDIPVYTGALSNLGVVIWSAAATVCLFTYGVNLVWATGGARSHFLLAGGLVTVWLLLDDLFMLHEVVFPEYLGVAEDIVYGTHIVILLAFLVWYRTAILHTPFLLLALAFVGFGVSVGADATASILSVPGLYVFEDGAKLFGIVSWARYFTLASARQIAAGRDQVPLS